jgi:hypothetical protein
MDPTDPENCQNNIYRYPTKQFFKINITRVLWTQVGSLSYLEGRLNKKYEESRGKLRERRRQDVRDQADILAAQSAASFSLSMDLVQVGPTTKYFAKKT